MSADKVFFDGTLLIRQRSLPTYRLELFQEIAKHCNRLCLVCSRSTSEQAVREHGEASDFEIVRLVPGSIGKGVALLYWQKSLIREVSRCQPDAIITEANPRFADTRRLRAWANHNGAAFLGWGLGTTNFFGHGFTRIRHWRRSQTLRQFDALIAYSSLAKQQYCSEYRFPTDRVFIAHNATSNACERAVDSHDRSARSESRFRVLTIGRLIENKNLQLLIDAVAQIPGHSDGIEVVYIGEGPSKSMLETHAKNSGVNVQFLGHLEGPELAEQALRCDLFVLPGLGGLAIQQAMSFGLPVIVANADGTEIDLVRDNGWRIKPDDPVALANAIECAWTNPTATRGMGLESLRIVRDEINVHTMARKIIHAVATTVGQVGSRRNDH